MHNVPSQLYIKILICQQLSYWMFPSFILLKRTTLSILFNHILREEPQKTNGWVKGSNMLFMHISKVLSKAIRLIYNPTNKKGHVHLTDCSALLTISNLTGKETKPKQTKPTCFSSSVNHLNICSYSLVFVLFGELFAIFSLFNFSIITILFIKPKWSKYKSKLQLRIMAITTCKFKMIA